MAPPPPPRAAPGDLNLNASGRLTELHGISSELQRHPNKPGSIVKFPIMFVKNVNLLNLLCLETNERKGDRRLEGCRVYNVDLLA